MKLYNFLVNLTTTQSRRTVLRAVINTLESPKLEEIVERSQVLEFFQALDRIFQLEYGKVLLAMSSSLQLEDMLERELPFLANYTEEVRSCLNASSCDDVKREVDSLGKVMLYFGPHHGSRVKGRSDGVEHAPSTHD